LDSSNLEDDMFADEQPKKAEDAIPLMENGWASFGDYRLVGNGEVTNSFCGVWCSFRGCLNVDKHDKTDLYGNNFSRKIYVEPVFHSCNKPSCPVCYKSGWAVRQAGRIEARLKEASKRFGRAEHIICSVPSRDYGLEFKALRRKAVKVLKVRGVVGGVLIFHGFRFNKRKWNWYWSPHFHVLGFVLGGYGRCRGCNRKWNCLKNCGGFDDRSYQCFLKDGYFVKVLGKRETVFGTAWYQLHHASVKKNVVRFHVATWFGVVSYRKLKVTIEKRKEVCPICQHDLVRVDYFGDKRFVEDRCSLDYVRDSFEDFREDGRVVWFEHQGKAYGSGSYDE